MSLNLKVGDKVRIRKNLSLKEYGNFCVVDPMLHYAGKEAVVMVVNTNSVRLDLDYCKWYWTPEMFETAFTPQSIHLTLDADGKTINAVHKIDDKVVKRAKAICAPGDAFDFTTGAKLALERLFTPEAPKPVILRFDYDSFLSGKYAVRCVTEAEAREFLAFLHGKGVCWNTGEPVVKASCWSKYGSNTAYSMNGDRLGYCAVSYYVSRKIPAIPYRREEL